MEREGKVKNQKIVIECPGRVVAGRAPMTIGTPQPDAYITLLPYTVYGS